MAVRLGGSYNSWSSSRRVHPLAARPGWFRRQLAHGSTGLSSLGAGAAIFDPRAELDALAALDRRVCAQGTRSRGGRVGRFTRGLFGEPGRSLSLLPTRLPVDLNERRIR